MRSSKIAALALILLLLATTLPACISGSGSTSVGNGTVESYVALAPKTMQAGQAAAVTFTLLDQDSKLTRDSVSVTLSSEGKKIASAEDQVIGKGSIQLQIPANLPEGDYDLQIEGSDFKDNTSIRVERTRLIFIETDKPIYKPGQTIHIRAITLTPDLLPASQTLTIDVLDAKGIKIFRREVSTDDYGMTSLDLPLSAEPNLGVWKINATAGDYKTQLDVRVEEYVLPKYEVSVDLAKEWFLINETIPGIVKAEYSFGKPVAGELEIVASLYVGKWEEFARVSKNIEDETDFEIPAVRYVAGTPAGRGMGNVTLDITVREKSTGYEEKTSVLLTIAESPLTIQIVPEGTVFKPGLPFDFLIVTETPDNQPQEADVSARIRYFDKDLGEIKTQNEELSTQKGMGVISVTPPDNSVALTIDAFELTPISSRQPAQASKSLEAGYSPSGNFIHLEQVSQGIPQPGDELTFRVHSTREAVNFYYEIVSKEQVIFSDFTNDNDIIFTVTPQMAPSAKLLIYQILPNSEIAADYLPFSVDASYPQNISIKFSQDEARPGDEITLNINAEDRSMVGIAVVDKSVFILAENRLNLQQVFDELERLYMQPQVELHEVNIYEGITTRGAQDVFKDAGMVVMSNQKVPDSEEYQSRWAMMEEAMGGMGFKDMDDAAFPVPAATPAPMPPSAPDGQLAEVERVRQFFPETWLWVNEMTDDNGDLSLDVAVPDTITTWMLHAVALSKEKGLGMAEAQLRAFQPFFLKMDLPYSSIRGEEFPVSVAIYNYLDETQEVFVEIEDADWFNLLDTSEKSVKIGPNDIGGVEFKISPRSLGINRIKITARSTQAADAAIKTVIVEPEGVSREEVQNLTLSGGGSDVLSTRIPADAVVDSGRAYLAVTSSFLTQTIDGLEGLLQMPFGCGEQNMIAFAPDVFITKYLNESGQIKPEIMAKAEKLMITGYQRELTYRHSDGSFSAFGESDESGSLWLTAFVLKSFAQAKGLIYIDQEILDEASTWIKSHQHADGSFESVGFIHHQDMLGGLSGKDALTAYVAITLMEASETSAANRAINYLEGQLADMDDSYTLAITAYALALADSPKKGEAHDMLMDIAKADENGIYWGEDIRPMPLMENSRMMPPMGNQSAVVETTAYATLALIHSEDAFNTSSAAKWLVSQRNAYGGYGSTQDTVVALQALTEYSSDAKSDVDLRVIVIGDNLDKEIQINEDNFDVLQIIELPMDSDIRVNVAGEGEAIAQMVTRYNLPDTDQVAEPVMKVDVSYDVTEVEVNDIVRVSASVEFNPTLEMGMNAETGMVVVDISVPTGFAPLRDSIAQAVEKDEKIKRYDIAGRKVIFYIENMTASEVISFSFDVQAQYPVKAKATSSKAYSYYQPEVSGETLGQDILVTG